MTWPGQPLEFYDMLNPALMDSKNQLHPDLLQFVFLRKHRIQMLTQILLSKYLGHSPVKHLNKSYVKLRDKNIENKNETT